MNLLSKLINPHFPAIALGLERSGAAAIHLQRQGKQFSLRRAATIAYPEALLRPSFDEPNIADAVELADALLELATSAGLQRQHRWTVALPEAAARAVILTLESAPTSRGELEEVLRWKTERSFGATFEELRVSRERLSPDADGRARYLAIGMHVNVIDEYESLFQSLGWRAGLILPRHVGESRWLRRANRAGGDGLLLSSHHEGFTSVLLRGTQTMFVRSVICDEEDRDDELFRLLLYYRDRVASAASSSAPDFGLERYLVVGEGFSRERVGELIGETLGAEALSLTPVAMGLNLPTSDIAFAAIAAPAGLATLSWE